MSKTYQRPPLSKPMGKFEILVTFLVACSLTLVIGLLIGSAVGWTNSGRGTTDTDTPATNPALSRTDHASYEPVSGRGLSRGDRVCMAEIRGEDSCSYVSDVVGDQIRVKPLMKGRVGDSVTFNGIAVGTYTGEHNSVSGHYSTFDYF